MDDPQDEIRMLRWKLKESFINYGLNQRVIDYQAKRIEELERTVRLYKQDLWNLQNEKIKL